MSFLRRVQKPPQAGEPPQVGGMIGYYGLGDWWLSTFTEAERKHIEATYKPLGASDPMLAHGSISGTSLDAVSLLHTLAGWFQQPACASIASRLLEKRDELVRLHPVRKPGYYQGRHFTTYVDDVKALKRNGNDQEAERLLLALVEATEAESRVDGVGVAPWYYEQLAILYAKRKDDAAELAILQRFARQKHAPGVKPGQLDERLAKVQARLRPGGTS